MGAFRILAWIMVAVGLALLGADIMSSLEGGILEIRTTAEILAMMGLEIANVESGPIAPIINFFLNAPLWGVIGGLGVILTLVFRPLD